MRFICALLLLVAGCSRGPSDELIATRIKAKFFADPLVKVADVTVTVLHGDVTLGGAAASNEVELRAFQLVTGTEGVRRIRDEIQLVPPSHQPPSNPPLRAAAADAPAVRPMAATKPAAAPSEQDYVASAPPAPSEIAEAWQPFRPAASAPLVEEMPPHPSAAGEPAGAAVALPTVVQAEPAVVVDVWKGRQQPAQREHGPVLIAGSTAAMPQYQAWLSRFRQSEPQADVEYLPLDTDYGARALTGRSIDLSAVDAPLHGSEHRSILHVPVAVQGIALICNLGDRQRALNLTGEVLAAIYLRRIAKWDDAALQMLNPGVSLPSASIVLVQRADAAYSSFGVLSDFLAARSSDWKSHQPFYGITAKGNEGVAAQVRRTPFSIGYVEARFAEDRKLATCAMLNHSGRYVRPSGQTLTAAGKANRGDLRTPLFDAPDANAYPIASFTYLLAPNHIAEAEKRHTVRALLSWMLTKGQEYADAPIPKDLASQIQEQVRKIR